MEKDSEWTEIFPDARREQAAAADAPMTELERAELWRQNQANAAANRAAERELAQIFYPGRSLSSGGARGGVADPEGLLADSGTSESGSGPSGDSSAELSPDMGGEHRIDL